MLFRSLGPARGKVPSKVLIGEAKDGHGTPRQRKLHTILEALPSITDAGLNRIHRIVLDELLQDDDGDPASESVDPE